MSNIYCCKMYFQEFRRHFKKMSDDEIISDIRKSCECLDDLDSEGNSWGAQCVREASEKMEIKSKINSENAKSRWDKEQPEKKETPEEQPTKQKGQPTQEELSLYASEINVSSYIQEQFFDYFQSNGWRVGKNPMKDWKAALRNWVRRGGKEEPFRPPTQEEMNLYAVELKFNNSFEIAQFSNYYKKKGWAGIHDWKAAMNAWANKWKASQNG